MAWRVYYSDGSTFGSDEGEPRDAPGHGVVCIAQHSPADDEHAPPRQVQHRWDWYFWHPEHGCWWGCDVDGLHDRLLHRLPTEAVCQGRSVRSVTYRELMRRAAEEPLP